MRPLATGVLLFVIAGSRAAARSRRALDLSRHRMVDLSHAYGASTLYWPTSPTKFTLETLAKGKTDGGLLLRRQHALHAGARRHAPGRAVPFLRVRPDDGTDSARAADRAGRRHRRYARKRRRIATTASRGRTSCSSRNRTAPSRPARSSCCGRDGAATGRTRRRISATTRPVTPRSCRSRPTARTRRSCWWRKERRRARDRYRVDRLRQVDRVRGAPHRRGQERPRAREPHQPRPVAPARRARHRPADEDRERLRRPSPRRRPRPGERTLDPIYGRARGDRRAAGRRASSASRMDAGQLPRSSST